MVFGSLYYLTVFLPPVLLVHWALQALARRWPVAATFAANVWLLAASIAACVLSDLPGLPWFLGCAVATDLIARAIAAAGPRRPRLRKTLLAFALAGDLALLCLFKYGGTLSRWIDALAGCALVPAAELAVPLGLSFWVFRSMSYVWDVARGVHPPARTPIDLLCYLALFPIFVSGPIVRWADVAGSFRARPFSAALAASGWRRLLVGLAKKILVANQLAPMADAVWAVAEGGGGMSPGMAALGVASYSLQLYFDFSGYSDMAIGLGRLLGFDFRENFLWPYASASIREFWRRWHVSLSTWFRDYLYIPLGGSRRGTARACLNGIVVFTLCGAWHGTGWMFPGRDVPLLRGARLRDRRDRLRLDPLPKRDAGRGGRRPALARGPRGPRPGEPRALARMHASLRNRARRGRRPLHPDRPGASARLAARPAGMARLDGRERRRDRARRRRAALPRRGDAPVVPLLPVLRAQR